MTNDVLLSVTITHKDTNTKTVIGYSPYIKYTEHGVCIGGNAGLAETFFPYWNIAEMLVQKDFRH